MENLSRSFVDFMIKNGIIIESAREIYLFGFVLMLRTVLNISTLVLIGIFFNMTGEVVAFIVCSLMIRSYSGGFHASNPIICYLISVVAVTLMLLSIKLGIWNLLLSFVVVLLSIVIILVYAPVEYKNKPLEEIERKIYRKKLLISIAVLLLMYVFFRLTHHYFILFSMSFALLVSAIMILACKR